MTVMQHSISHCKQ